MVLPHTRGKPVTFLRDGSLEECHEENTTGVWLLRADSGEIEKDRQHAVLRQMKGRL